MIEFVVKASLTAGGLIACIGLAVLIDLWRD